MRDRSIKRNPELPGRTRFLPPRLMVHDAAQKRGTVRSRLRVTASAPLRSTVCRCPLGHRSAEIVKRHEILAAGDDIEIA